MARSDDSAVTGAVSGVGTPARLLRATVLLAALFLGGMGGYMVVEGAPWFDALYMTVITITTVGFGEAFPLSQAGQVLTMVLLVAGLGVFFGSPDIKVGRSGATRKLVPSISRSR